MKTLIFCALLLATFAQAQVTLSGSANLQGNFTMGATSLASSPMFGFNETNTLSTNFPSVSYGMQRFWDSPPLQWPSINTAPGVFDFSNLDAALAQDYSSGVTEALYTLARTPPWITSNPTDTLCNYQLRECSKQQSQVANCGRSSYRCGFH